MRPSAGPTLPVTVVRPESDGPGPARGPAGPSQLHRLCLAGGLGLEPAAAAKGRGRRGPVRLNLSSESSPPATRSPLALRAITDQHDHSHQ